MTDLDVLRCAHPAPDDITLSPEHRARLAARIDERIARLDACRRVLLGIAAPTTVLACAAAVAALVVLTVTGPPRPPVPVAGRPVIASSAAVQVLDGAADRVLASPEVTVREDQFVYTRSATIANEGRFGEDVVLGAVHEREVWLGQDPSAYGWHGDMIREFGQDWPLDRAGPSPASAQRPTYAWLAALPTDPSELLDELDRAAVPVDGQEQEQATFELIGSLLSEQIVPPRIAAALYRAVARIDGVEVDRRATDALGRRGIGISRRDARFRTRTTWIFDARTYEMRGTRWYFTHPDHSPDILFGATAILETAVVDRAGQAPGSSA